MKDLLFISIIQQNASKVDLGLGQGVVPPKHDNSHAVARVSRQTQSILFQIALITCLKGQMINFGNTIHFQINKQSGEEKFGQVFKKKWHEHDFCLCFGLWSEKNYRLWFFWPVYSSCIGSLKCKCDLHGADADSRMLFPGHKWANLYTQVING